MIHRLAWLSFICWTVGLAYLLLIPGTDIPKVKLFEFQDKVAHFVLFSVWCFLFVVGIKRNRRFDAILVFIIGVCLAGLTEWLQVYIPNRTPDFFDFGLDLVGVATGIILGIFIKKELIST